MRTKKIKIQMPLNGDWQTLKSLGFVQGDRIDDLLVFAFLPDGWDWETTRNLARQQITDDNGVERVTISYKKNEPHRHASFSIKNGGTQKRGRPLVNFFAKHW